MRSGHENHEKVTRLAQSAVRLGWVLGSSSTLLGSSMAPYVDRLTPTSSGDWNVVWNPFRQASSRLRRVEALGEVRRAGHEAWVVVDDASLRSLVVGVRADVPGVRVVSASLFQGRLTNQESLQAGLRRYQELSERSSYLSRDRRARVARHYEKALRPVAPRVASDGPGRVVLRDPRTNDWTRNEALRAGVPTAVFADVDRATSSRRDYVVPRSWFSRSAARSRDEETRVVTCWSRLSYLRGALVVGGAEGGEGGPERGPQGSEGSEGLGSEGVGG